MFLVEITMLAVGNLNLSSANVSETFTLSWNYTTKNVTEVVTMTQFPIERSTFSYYVDGLYGADCTNRIMNYVQANKIPFSLPNLNCACYGICIPPLASNPAAASWVQSQLVTLKSASIESYFRDKIVFVITGVLCCAVLLVSSKKLYYY